MHFLVTIPMSKYDLSVADRYRSMVSELFSRGGRLPIGDHYFLRTWDQRTAGECVQAVIEVEDAEAPGVLDVVNGVARENGFEADVRETPPAEVPSPLWNVGFAGISFDRVSKALYRDASPLASEFAGAARESVGGAYRLALRLMAEHDKATLVGSEQRGVSPLGFGDLLSTRLLSFRSHYEGMAARVRDRESFEGRCEKYYEDFGHYARGLVSSCMESENPTDDPHMRQWALNISGTTKPLREEVREGRIVNVGLTLDDLNRDRETLLSPAGFHAFGADSEAFQYLMNSDPDFMAFRIQAGLLYSCLHTIGFSLPERFVLCYILGRANEDVSGKSANELQERLMSVAEGMYARTDPAREGQWS